MLRVDSPLTSDTVHISSGDLCLFVSAAGKILFGGLYLYAIQSTVDG
jgi:hypothetical protein